MTPTLTSPIRLIAALACLTFAAAAIGEVALGERTDGLSPFGDLPSGLDKVPPSGSAEERASMLAKQPDLVLDHQVLRLADASRFPNILITVNRLRLLRGSVLVTNGANVQITATSIESDGGRVVSFEDGRFGPPAGAGLDGSSGHDGGTLVLDGELAAAQRLHVNLMGQDGQDGGQGLPGPSGVQGTRGESGADHILDCAHGAGDGGVGSKGGSGGRGGAGGRGGGGGKLILRNGVVFQRSQIEFLAPGGNPGAGGRGGQGGPGGLGGPGGSHTTYCRQGSQGQQGRTGDEGDAGTSGIPGAPGTLVAD